jgi:GNAT superfamily N-acetyltransferase
MASRFILETPYKDTLLPDERRLERLAAWLIDQGGVILLAERLVAHPVGATGLTVCHETVGMLALAHLEHHLTGEFYVDEICWWVETEHRKTAAGYRLLCAAEDWTRQKGARVLKMLSPAGADIGKLYERRGYRPLETAFLLTV